MANRKMASRKKKREPATEATEAEREVALGYAITREAVNQHLDEMPENPMPVPDLPMSKTLLDSMREEAIAHRRHTTQTIAELEEWRAEIERTIAVLRAR